MEYIEHYMNWIHICLCLRKTVYSICAMQRKFFLYGVATFIPLICNWKAFTNIIKRKIWYKIILSKIVKKILQNAVTHIGKYFEIFSWYKFLSIDVEQHWNFRSMRFNTVDKQNKKSTQCARVIYETKRQKKINSNCFAVLVEPKIHE